MGLNAGFDALLAMSLPYENTLPTSSGVPVGLAVVLQASVFPYGVSSVVVAQLSVKQLDRVRFPLSPQKFLPRSSNGRASVLHTEDGSSILSRGTKNISIS